MPGSPNDQLTDNELLMRYVRHRDEAAMRILVERHGALVMNVCRQVVQDEHHAEDVFQATFLILARWAKRLLHVSSLAGWLHRVAFRTAVRVAQQQRRRREAALTEEPMVDRDEALANISSVCARVRREVGFEPGAVE